MNGRIIRKEQGDMTADLEKINRYTRRAFTAQEVYTFSVVLCDNEIDRDFERFERAALPVLGRLFLGKTGIFDHDASAGNQAARIYDTAVEQVQGKVTSFGEPYVRVVAKAYLPRCDKNADLITEIESGMKKEVSIGCAVARRECSICGAHLDKEVCRHRKGETYDVHGKQEVCCTVLCEPTDAYEWSFVAVPAQREAGVIKMRKGMQRSVPELLTALEQAQGSVTLLAEEAHALAEHLQRMAEFADCGKAYREEVSRNVVKLCGIAQPEIGAAVIKRVAEGMSLADLKVFEKAFYAKAETVLPLTPQLAAAQPPAAEHGKNLAFKI